MNLRKDNKIGLSDLLGSFLSDIILFFRELTQNDEIKVVIFVVSKNDITTSGFPLRSSELITYNLFIKLKNFKKKF